MYCLRKNGQLIYSVIHEIGHLSILALVETKLCNCKNLESGYFPIYFPVASDKFSKNFPLDNNLRTIYFKKTTVKYRHPKNIKKGIIYIDENYLLH